jgi:nicotinic acid mononucleotide adenylyltransferase
VWVLPVYQHTFAAKADLLAFEHRVAMCELSFASVAGPTGRVKVKRVEEELATLLGTADASVRTAIRSLLWR